MKMKSFSTVELCKGMAFQLVNGGSKVAKGSQTSSSDFAVSMLSYPDDQADELLILNSDIPSCSDNEVIVRLTQTSMCSFS